MCPNFVSKSSVKKTFMVFGTVLIGLWGVAGHASGTKENHDHSNMDHSKMAKHKAKINLRKPLSEGAKKSVVAALEANEALHNVFFKYDAKKVEENALKLNQMIDGIEDKEVSKLLKFSKTKLLEIKASSDREANNKNYHLVSMALIHIVNKYDVGTKYNAYSCPMVKKKWIQNSKKISKVHNPYTPNMPNCGSKDSSY